MSDIQEAIIFGLFAVFITSGWLQQQAVDKWTQRTGRAPMIQKSRGQLGSLHGGHGTRDACRASQADCAFRMGWLPRAVSHVGGWRSSRHSASPLKWWFQRVQATMRLPSLPISAMMPSMASRKVTAPLAAVMMLAFLARLALSSAATCSDSSRSAASPAATHGSGQYEHGGSRLRFRVRSAISKRRLPLQTDAVVARFPADVTTRFSKAAPSGGDACLNGRKNFR